LQNRQQRVVLQFVNSPNLLSEWEVVRHEVSQGSVLGPLLFNVYINDFPYTINKVSHTILFADDTNSLVSSIDINELDSKLNSILHCISKWFPNNQLALNLNKMHIVKFVSSKLLTYPLNMVHNNQALTVSKNIKLLGVHLDCNLTWKSHTDNLIKQLILICCILRKLSIVNVKMLLMVYFAHFYSQFSYGKISWGSSSSLKNIFIIQKRTIRNILRLNPRSCCIQGFKKLDILTVSCYIFRP
jgi:hypothetical protein